MNIDELNSYNLKDAVRFHNKLNPRLWGRDEHLLPEVRDALLAIAADFQEFLGIDDLEVKDITISGSNAAYSYTPHSDIDLHLVVDIPEASDEVYRELFNAKKYQYNESHNIRVRNSDVELYVQPADESHVSQGIYSIKNNKWIDVPKRKRAKIDDASVRHKYEDLSQRIKQALKSKDYDKISAVISKIKDMRSAGLAEKGEFGAENLAYKILRTQGLIAQLFDTRNRIKDRELSLKEREPKNPVKYGFRSITDEASLSTPDGVSASTCMFTDSVEPTSTADIVRDFYNRCCKEVGIDSPPRLRLHKDPEWSKRNKTFGMYDNNKHEIHLSLTKRHVMDVLRTLAHELIHARQHEVENVPDDAGDTGSKFENEANALAGILMRDFGKEYPEYFGLSINEAKSKYTSQQFDQWARQYAAEHRVPLSLVRHVMKTETGWMNNPDRQAVARSPAGAIGVMQLMPRTARSLGVKNIKDPQQNIEAGVRLLGQLLARYKDPATVIIAYNWGSGNLERWRQKGAKWAELPKETQNYVNNFIQATPRLASAPTAPTQPQSMLKKFGQALTTAIGIRPAGAAVQEGASGYIPSKAEKNDPRYKTALTVDIKPDTMKKNAAKLGSKISRAGIPPLLMKESKESSNESWGVLAEDDLFEVAMTPKALQSWANSPEAQGIMAGFEAELIFEDMYGERESEDIEPDWDSDERTRSIDNIIDFFESDDWGYGLSSASSRRLRNDLVQEYYEWIDERLNDADLVNEFTEFMDENYWADRRDTYVEMVLADRYPDSWEDILSAGDDKEDPKHELFKAALEEARAVWLEDIMSVYTSRDAEEWLEFYEQYRDEFADDNDENEWLRGSYPYMTDVMNAFTLDWPYYTENDNYGGRDPDELSRSLSAAVNAPVKMSSGYHTVGRKPGRWIIETDSSISPDNSEDYGYEIVSPPQPLKKTLQDMQTVLDWARSQDAYTNGSTGLHMNISIPYRGADVDMVKLLLFMGDEFVLREFERQAVMYCRSSLEKLKNQLDWSQGKNIPDAFTLMQKNLIELAGRTIYEHSGEKYQSANVHSDTNVIDRREIKKPKYIEFRGPGGNYLDKGDEFVSTTMLRLARAMQIAGDPSAERKQYAKKLYKLLAPEGNNDELSLFAKYSTGEISAEELKKQWAAEVIGKTPDQHVPKPVEIFNTKTGEVLARQVMPDSEIRSWIENNVDKDDWMDIDFRYVSDASIPLSARRKGLAARIKGTDPNLRPGLINYTAYIKTGDYPSLWSYPFKSPDIGRDFAKGTDAVRRSLLKAGYSEEQMANFRIEKITSEDGPMLKPTSTDSPPEVSIYQIVNNQTGEVLRAGESMNWNYARALADDIVRRRGLGRVDIRIIDLENNRSYSFDGRPTFSAGSNTLAPRTPSRDQEFTGVWEIVSRNTDEVVSIMSGLGNSVADAEAHAANWARDTGFDDPIYVRPRMQARQQAQGTGSLPPAGTRWLVLDQNDREVYSFVHRNNQAEANQYAINWLRGNNMIGHGEFMVVPVT